MLIFFSPESIMNSIKITTYMEVNKVLVQVQHGLMWQHTKQSHERSKTEMTASVQENK